MLPAAEAIDDPAILALLLANLARAYMRNAASAQAVDAADRALAIAERLDLEDVLAEALLNRAAGLQQLGRRVEATALSRVALEIARRRGDRMFEMRALNNHGTNIVWDYPTEAHAIYQETARLARDIGDRGIYVFALSNVSAQALSMGEWDSDVAELLEAYEVATLPGDRIRLGVHLALRDVFRGERVEEWLTELRAIVGDRGGFEFRHPLLMAQALGAYQAGRYAEACALARDALALGGPNSEVPSNLALRAAIGSGEEDLIREAADRIIALPMTGAIMSTMRDSAEAALAALDGRSDAAASLFVRASERLARIGARYDAALVAVNAHTMLPGHPALATIVADARAVLEGLAAWPALQRLDRTPAPQPNARTSTAVAPAETV